MAAGAVLLLWWTGLLQVPIARSSAELLSLGVDLGPLATVDWSALKAALFWPVVAYCAALIVQGAVLLLRPRQVRVQGLFDVLIAGSVLALTAWLWTASPIAGAVQVGSFAEFAQRMREAFSYGPPFPLAPLLTLVLLVTGFGAACRMMRGVWELVAGAPNRGSAAGAGPTAQLV